MKGPKVPVFMKGSNVSNDIKLFWESCYVLTEGAPIPEVTRVGVEL